MFVVRLLFLCVFHFSLSLSSYSSSFFLLLLTPHYSFASSSLITQPSCIVLSATSPSPFFLFLRPQSLSLSQKGVGTFVSGGRRAVLAALAVGMRVHDHVSAGDVTLPPAYPSFSPFLSSPSPSLYSFPVLAIFLPPSFSLNSFLPSLASFPLSNDPFLSFFPLFVFPRLFISLSFFLHTTSLALSLLYLLPFLPLSPPRDFCESSFITSILAAILSLTFPCHCHAREGLTFTHLYCCFFLSLSLVIVIILRVHYEDELLGLCFCVRTEK